jgi:2-dehydropantoate 2-reductase
MSDRKPSVAILGAGLIGLYCGAFAQRAGCDVTFVGRDRLKRQVKEHGILVTTFQATPEAKPEIEFHLKSEAVRYVTSLPPRSEIGKLDYIVVCLKCGQGQTEEGAKAILASGHCDISLSPADRSTVITFQNGARNPEVLRLILPEGTLVLAGSWPFNICPGSRPGEIHQGVLGGLKLQKAPEAEAFQKAVASAGLPCDLFEDMEAQLVGKLITNANNAVNALSGLSLQKQISQRDFRIVVVGTQKEALAVLEKAKIPFSGMPAGGLEGWFKVMEGPDEIVTKIIKVDAAAGSSMADDLLNQRWVVPDCDYRILR